ncbi:ester cyclase [Labilithrix luteola]|uniref:ester cyclase n=1 Tax=Labilithrix luteola TaxID=1391654 RepID=UPI0011BAA815|nr:ester cyclase [Labilithrix luteola]
MEPGQARRARRAAHPDYVNHSPSTPNPPAGPKGLVPIVRAMREGIPDLRYRIDDLIVTDDAAAVRLWVTGTHEGSLFGLAPTHRRFEVAQMNFERFREGRIVAHHRLTDELGMMRQLGIVG